MSVFAVVLVILAVLGPSLRFPELVGAAGFDPLSLVGLAGAPVVVALVQLVKTSWPDLPTRWFPLFSLFFSVALNLAVALVVSSSLPIAALLGLVTGLAASGFYSWGGALRR